jgi:hypothetical protein
MPNLVDDLFFQWQREEEQRQFLEKVLAIKHYNVAMLVPFVMRSYYPVVVRGDDGAFSYNYGEAYLPNVNYKVKVFLN